MLCQKCGQRQATVFISQTVNNKTTHIHLCEECAVEQTALGGMNPFSVTLDPSSMLKDFFSTLFPGFQAMEGVGGGLPGGRVLPEEMGIQCPVCGYQFSLFKQTGRLGCPKCYESFASLLEPVLAGIHGKFRQTEDSSGGAPAAPPTPPAPEGDPKIAELRSLLEKAVKEERYEEAAKLRDNIRKMKGA